MAVAIEEYKKLMDYCGQHQVTLVAVSKTKPMEDIQALYDLGHRDFGENYVQELVEKEEKLPKDIRWHFIGHLQSNKVKYIAPFIHLIHGVDSFKLLKEVHKQGTKNEREIDCLLQIFIATEESKFGLDEAELQEMIADPALGSLTQARVRGLMGMASFSDNKEKVATEFQGLKKLYDQLKSTTFSSDGFDTLSMGMSGDYEMAINAGSSMIRIGSMLFGARNQ